MFRKSITRALTVAGTVAILAFAAVATAAAAPAETTSIKECYPDQYGDQAGTICYTIHSVDNYSSNDKSGQAKSKENGSMLIEFFDAAGDLVFSDKTQWRRTIIEKDGEWQVYHNKVSVTFSEGGQTCTNGQNAVYANGEVRHLGPEWEWVCN